LLGIAAQLLGWVPFRLGGAPGEAIVVAAAALILYEGGEGLEVAVLGRVWPTVALLATLGVAISLAITAAAATVFLHVPVGVGILVGAVLAATDPAVLIPIHRSLSLAARVSHTLIAEAALNDATAAMATSVAAAVLGGAAVSPPGAGLELVRLAGVGVAVGAAIGVTGVALVAQRPGIMPSFAGALTFPVAVLSYLLSELLGGSGLIGAFTAGAVAGNGGRLRLAAAERTHEIFQEFQQPAAVMLRALLFVGLGASLNLRGALALAAPALAVVAALVLVARPLSVAACALPDRRARWSWREVALFAWTRPTGVVPAALAAVLLARGVHGAEAVAAVVAVAILVTVLLQGMTAGPVARRLDLLDESASSAS
jgi:cell volume regulation protein A